MSDVGDVGDVGAEEQGPVPDKPVGIPGRVRVEGKGEGGGVKGRSPTAATRRGEIRWEGDQWSIRRASAW